LRGAGFGKGGIMKYYTIKMLVKKNADTIPSKLDISFATPMALYLGEVISVRREEAHWRKGYYYYTNGWAWDSAWLTKIGYANEETI
jgi:hypothetical protein